MARKAARELAEIAQDIYRLTEELRQTEHDCIVHFADMLNLEIYQTLASLGTSSSDGDESVARSA